jgi:hypothetical protein
MIKPSDVTFLNECARYFEQIAARSKEDREHWAGVYNAENLRRIAAILTSLSNRVA